MNRWVGKVAVVTGCSSGIGLAVTKSLLENGMQVVGLDKNLEMMQKRLGDLQNFHGKKCDISVEEEVKITFSWIKDNVGSIQVLVNNAGVVKLGSLIDLYSESMKEVIDVNLMGTLYCTREAGKLMKQSDKEAIIIFISSILAHITPNRNADKINVYPATKFAVRGVAEICRKEFLKNPHIRVSNISPGRVDTNVFKTAGVRNGHAENYPVLKPKDVADTVLHVISTPRRVNITELTIVPLGETY